MGCSKETHRCPGLHRCCHTNLLEILKFTTDLLDKKGIKYWLAYGTLLGAVRNKMMIPWDEDIDIGANIIDANRICMLSMKFINAGYGVKVSVMPTGKVCTFSIYYSFINELHVDIAFSENINGILKGVEFPGCEIAPNSLIDMPRIKFEKNTYTIPRNPEKVLEVYYGTNWSTPQIKKWIKYRLLKDPTIEDRIKSAISTVGCYINEVGRKKK